MIGSNEPFIDIQNRPINASVQYSLQTNKGGQDIQGDIRVGDKGTGKVLIDGTNNRIVIDDGTNNRIVIGDV